MVSARFICFALCAASIGLAGCAGIPLARTQAEATDTPKRVFDPNAIGAPPGYRVELVAKDLTYPVGVTFDEGGTPYVVEAGFAPGEAYTTPRVIKIEPTGRITVVAEGDNPPWTGVAYHGGNLVVTEGGAYQGGRIVRIASNGKRSVLAAGLPKLGEHRTHVPTVSDDGWVYFGQGAGSTADNDGDASHTLGWLQRHPELGGAVLRVPVTGGRTELVAWGFRNPSGLAFGPDGSLYATDNGYVLGAASTNEPRDFLWRVERGRWYGWPDDMGVRPASMEALRAAERAPFPLLESEWEPRPPKPAALFDDRGRLSGLDFSDNPKFGHEGEAFLVQFGGSIPSARACGFAIVNVDPRTGVVREFATNRSYYAGSPSSAGGGGFERPVDVRFDPSGDALYVVDFGWIRRKGESQRSMMGSGALWRIVADPDARPVDPQTVGYL